MNNLKKISLFVVAMGVFASCSKKPQFVKVDNVAIVGLKDSLLQVSMDYVIYNPNNVKTNLRQSGMQIFYGDSLVGHGYLDKQISLKAKDTLSVPVRFEMSLGKLQEHYSHFIASDSTVFAIKGNSRVSFLLNSFTIDMDDKIHLNTKQIIHRQIQKNLGTSDNFKIGSLSANKFPSLNRTNLQLQVETQNNLPIDYTINALKLDFFIDKEKPKVAQWKLASPLQQKSREKALIPVDVEISNFDILKQVKLSWLTKAEVNFNIVGEIEVMLEGYRFTVPVEDAVELTL